MKSLPLLAAVALYVTLGITTVTAVGVVGEVAIGWALPQPPLVQTILGEPPVEHHWGPLTAAATRPTERLGPLPLQVNAYTSGLPDWPARLLVWLSGDWRLGVVTHLGLGLLLLLLAHRFLRFYASPPAAAAGALVLASDWTFLFYKKVLGGTEVLLQASGLLLLWALWSRRWKGGTHGTVAIALGVGLGLLAKATFVATILAFGLAALATRWDRQALRPPAAVSPTILLGLVFACLSPTLLAAIHHLFLPAEAVSHDTLRMQLGRLLMPSPARESLWNLVYFFGNPVAFFSSAYGALGQPPLSASRTIGLLLLAFGVILEWRRPSPDAEGALLRYLSIAVPLQIALLLLLNRDLHHLAQATLPLALLSALSAVRLARSQASPRTARGWILTLLFVAPTMFSGIKNLRQTDAVVATIWVPTFTRAGQEELVTMLRDNGVKRLVTSDYEIYGMLEVLAPEIAVTHTWAAVGRGQREPAKILEQAAGGWYLSVNASAPMIYNWTPGARAVEKAAAEAGLRVEKMGTLDRGNGVDLAALYRVSSAVPGE